jgi:hypothetical protein
MAALGAASFVPVACPLLADDDYVFAWLLERGLQGFGPWVAFEEQAAIFA